MEYLLYTMLLLYVQNAAGLKVLEQVDKSCIVSTDQGTVNLQSVAKTADKQAAA